MNKNRKRTNFIKKSMAAATISSMLIGSISYAGTGSETVATEPEGYGAFAGVMAATAHIHEELKEQKSVNAPLPIASKVETEPEDSHEWDDKLMADVSSYLNIRALPGKHGKVIGRLRPTDIATVIGEEDGWYQISSGEVEGYVSSKYSLVGKDAKKVADELCSTFALCTAKTLNVREKPDIESDIIGTIKKNDILKVVEDLSKDGWVKVLYKDADAYVSSEYVSIETGELGSAMTAEEIEAAAAAARQARTTYNQSVNASVDEETLLAALLMCEAGSSPEGMLAVGGVVVNRLNAGYAGTIRDVIYQRGQFSPAGSGKLERQIEKGVSEDALNAAREALSGVDITGGCKSFRAASTGHPGINIGGNVFF